MKASFNCKKKNHMLIIIKKRSYISEHKVFFLVISLYS